jgi:hypothetical protein
MPIKDTIRAIKDIDSWHKKRGDKVVWTTGDTPKDIHSAKKAITALKKTKSEKDRPYFGIFVDFKGDEAKYHMALQDFMRSKGAIHPYGRDIIESWGKKPYRGEIGKLKWKTEKKAFWIGFCEKCASRGVSPLTVQTCYSSLNSPNTSCQYNGSSIDHIINTFAQALGRNS